MPFAQVERLRCGGERCQAVERVSEYRACGVDQLSRRTGLGPAPAGHAEVALRLTGRLLGAVAQAVDEDGDHAPAVRDPLVGHGLAQQGDGVEEIVGADVGTDVVGRPRRVEQCR